MSLGKYGIIGHELHSFVVSLHYCTAGGRNCRV